MGSEYSTQDGYTTQSVFTLPDTLLIKGFSDTNLLPAFAVCQPELGVFAKLRVLLG